VAIPNVVDAAADADILIIVIPHQVPNISSVAGVNVMFFYKYIFLFLGPLHYKFYFYLSG
jgi:hypothetical protein